MWVMSFLTAKCFIFPLKPNYQDVIKQNITNNWSSSTPPLISLPKTNSKCHYDNRQQSLLMNFQVEKSPKNTYIKEYPQPHFTPKFCFATIPHLFFEGIIRNDTFLILTVYSFQHPIPHTFPSALYMLKMKTTL